MSTPDSVEENTPENPPVNETDIFPAESSTSRSRSPFFWLAVFLVLNIVVPFFNIPSRTIAIIGAVALTFAYVIVVVCFAVAVARRKLPATHLIAAAVASLLLWLVLDNFVTPAVSDSIRTTVQQTLTRPGPDQLLQLLLAMTFTDMALLGLAVSAGCLAARMIQTPNMLGPVLAVIALIDVWGVLFGGIVAQMMEKTPEIAEKAMTKGPMIGAATESRWAIPLPNIGIGDYLFLGLLFGVLVLHNLNWRAAMNWVVLLVCIALIAITFGLIPALPGLLFIAIGVAIPNWKAFRYTREEKFALLYAGVFVAILTGALYWGFTSILPEAPSDADATSVQI